MRMVIACVGKLKEKYLRDACADYIKRISRFSRVDVVEVPAALPRSPGETAAALTAEGDKLLAAAPAGSYRIALCIEGRSMDSAAFARHLEEVKVRGVSDICFFIGGSNGLAPSVKAASDLLLSFSAFTMSHQIFRPVLLEQIYRACKIASGQTYHK